MSLDKNRIEELAERKQAEADRALEKYQELGRPADYSRYTNADDLAEALRVAANASDEHEYALWARGKFAQLSRLVSKTDGHPEQSDLDELFWEIKNAATLEV